MVESGGREKGKGRKKKREGERTVLVQERKGSVSKIVLFCSRSLHTLMYSVSLRLLVSERTLNRGI